MPDECLEITSQAQSSASFRNARSGEAKCSGIGAAVKVSPRLYTGQEPVVAADITPSRRQHDWQDVPKGNVSVKSMLRNQAVVVALLVLAGCSSFFSGTREIPISEEQKLRLRSLGEQPGTILPWVNSGKAGIHTVVVAFDGTNNDISNTPNSESATVVGRLYQDVADEISKGAEHSSISVSRLSAYYYPGPGCPSWVACPFDSAIGWSIWSTAHSALFKVKSDIISRNAELKELRVVVIGFSRGAATSRYFLNLLASEPQLNTTGNPIAVHSYALLFDTVATGLANHLDLSFPPNLDFAYHFVAENETRRFFGLVVDSDEGYENNPFAKLFYIPKRIIAIEVPGAHSDLGDSYKKGAGMAVTQFARMTMAEMGLSAPLVNYSCDLAKNKMMPGCRVLDEGLHDSRGTLDRWLGVPSPYGCSNHRERTVVPSKISPQAAMDVMRRRNSEINPRPPGNVLSFRFLENYRFISLGGEHPTLYPRVSDIGFNAVVVPVGDRLKVVLRGLNNDQVYTVPAKVLQRIRDIPGQSQVELNLIKGQPRWIVNGCIPEED